MWNLFEKIINAIIKNDFYWGTMIRADILKANIEKWIDKKFLGAYIGVENLNQENLDLTGKRIRIKEIFDLVRAMKKHGLFTGIFYVIGFVYNASLKNLIINRT